MTNEIMHPIAKVVCIKRPRYICSLLGKSCSHTSHPLSLSKQYCREGGADGKYVRMGAHAVQGLAGGNSGQGLGENKLWCHFPRLNRIPAKMPHQSGRRTEILTPCIQKCPDFGVQAFHKCVTAFHARRKGHTSISAIAGNMYLLRRANEPARQIRVVATQR